MADKASTAPAASSAEPKTDAVSQPTVDAKPEPNPDAPAVSANNAVPKPTTTEASTAAPTQPAKPASVESSAAPVTEPAKPAATDSNSAPTVPSAAKPTSTDNNTTAAAQAEKPASVEGDKPQPAPSAVPVTTSPLTEKRDISEDPTVPGKPASSASTTKAVEPPKPLGDKGDTIPPLSPAAKVTQRFTEPSPAGPASAGTICPSCGHRNRPGTLICDNCGTNLVGGVKASVGTRDLVSATEAATTASEALMDAAQLTAVESAGGSIFSDDMVLRIEIEGGATPMLVYPKQEIILGRRDPNTGTLPDVDMTAYSGYRMGVSRTHASIHLQDKQLNLSDRGSSNGTFLNGTRLVAHRPYPIKDGDEIRLGQMVLKVYFQSNKGRK